MVNGRYRHQNFWVHTTSFEEQEERGGTVLKIGFKFYRDWGNAVYADLLRTMTTKAKADNTINATDYEAIMKYGKENMGNIVESIMGYSLVATYFKEEDFMEFREIANYLENEMIKRAAEEDDEPEEEY
eukprot:10871818-Heterocapsa_arctica.AAC.1